MASVEEEREDWKKERKKENRKIDRKKGGQKKIERWEIFYRGWAICFDGDTGFAANGISDDDESKFEVDRSLAH